MAQNETYNINKTFPIYMGNGEPFYGLEIKKAAVESVVMSLGDKISGDVYYRDNSLVFTMQEYILLDGVKYFLVSPPTVVREGLVKDNSGLNGMTKYSLVFYHPMYMLGNFPFTDIAVTNDEEQYLAQNKTFSWIGNLFDFISKLNKNLENTEWTVLSSVSQEDEAQYQKAEKLSEVLSFDKNMISDALKTAYDTWEIPFTITSVDWDYSGVHKSFLIDFGLPSKDIIDDDGYPFVFKFGQGVGLKNNSRTPKNNKIVTRIVGSGSERNVPFGYPQIRWWGDQSWEWTEYENDDPTQQPTETAYPIYSGIVGGQYVKLIKHPFTRKTLMPSVYTQSVFNKVSPYGVRTLPDGAIVPNPNYNRQGSIIDYYDAIDTQDVLYPNPINPNAPSVEIHQFEDIYPRLGNKQIVNAYPINTSNTSGKIVEIPLISSFVANVLVPAQTASSIQNEKDAIQGLIDFLNSVNLGGIVIPYYESNTGGSYTYSAVVQPKGTGYNGIWVVNYTSNNFKVDNVELCEQSTLPAWDDTMDDDGKCVQSYFKIQLPLLDFDLYACASITESMQINMRSGACKGCTFNVMVDWEDYKKNFYNEKGEFDPLPHTQEGDGHVRNILKYPNSNTERIQLICQKDLETFGTIMPNIYQYPQADDEFVILGISLPTSYITNAQGELDSAMKEYMLENNVHYFDYPLKFDEYFLTTHQDILAQIKNNSIVTFRYLGSDMRLFIKQVVVKYGDGVLPQWDITLTDDIEIVLSKIGQVTDDVSRMRVQLSELQKYYSENIFSLIDEKLSRVADDVAQGRITFQQGLDAIGSVLLSNEIRSNDFASGLGGRGWRIDHMGNAEVESLKVRSYLEVIELLINRLQAQDGDTLFTDNDQIDKVEVYEHGGATTYILSLKEKYEGYFTSQMYGNILKGIINTLAAKEAGVSDYEWAVATYSSSVNPMEEGYYERSGEEGSYVYTPTIDTAMSPAKTYYYHPTVENDGSNSYYTSWMQVVGTNATEPSICGKNQIRVVLYGDDQTPAGKNFVPCELMTIARWGCIDYADPQSEDYQSVLASIKRRQQLFYISTSEGRIVKLNGVNSPKLSNGNYGTTLGELPEFVKAYSAVAPRLVNGGDYLYAQGIVVGDFIKIDKQGLPLVNYVDRGEWQDHTEYLVNEYNPQSLQWETHDVWYNGKYWRCKMHQPHNGTYNPPVDGSDYWEELLRSGLDGESAPYYFQEWYAWSNVASTVNVTTSPFVEPYIGWQTSIPNQGNLAYLWRKSIRFVWNATRREYEAENAQYFRMSGTDGTSIHTMGSVDYENSSQGSGTALDLISNPADGDAYVVGLDLQGHEGWLYQWTNESRTWISLGQFKGESGKTYYTHIAWATNVVYDSSTPPQVTRVDGFTPDKSPNDTTHLWMGVLVDENSGQDSGNATHYTWSYTKGVNGEDPIYTTISNELDNIVCDDNGKPKTAQSISTTVAMYKGSTKLSCSLSVFDENGNQYTSGVEKDGVTASINDYFGIVSFSFSTSIAQAITRHLTIRLSATIEGTSVIKNLTFTVNCTRGNAIYSLVPSTTSILKQKDNTYTPAQYSCSVIKNVSGTEVTPPTSEYLLFWRKDESAQWEPTSVGTSFYSNQITKNAEFRLVVGGHEVDKQTIPLISDGTDGARGKVGRAYYYAGEFDLNDNTTFPVSDVQAPYFSHPDTSNPNIIRYHVFNYDTNGSYTMEAMWIASGGDWNNAPWESMTTDFKYLITEAIFSKFANFGSAIINGDWMMSTNGSVANKDFYNGEHIEGKYFNGNSFSFQAFELFDSQNPTSNGNTIYEYDIETGYDEHVLTNDIHEYKLINNAHLTSGKTYFVKVDCYSSPDKIPSGTRKGYGKCCLRISYGQSSIDIGDLLSDENNRYKVFFFQVINAGDYKLDVYSEPYFYVDDPDQTPHYPNLWLDMWSYGDCSFAPRYALDLRSGMAIQGYGWSSGSIRRSKVIIDNTSWTYYTKEFTGYASRRYLDIEVCGSFVEIRDNYYPLLQLPVFCSSAIRFDTTQPKPYPAIPPTGDECDYVRSFVGTKILIYVKKGGIDSSFVRLQQGEQQSKIHEGVFYTKLSRDKGDEGDEGESVASYKSQAITEGQFVELECVSGVDADGEIVYWKVNAIGNMAG